MVHLRTKVVLSFGVPSIAVRTLSVRFLVAVILLVAATWTLRLASSGPVIADGGSDNPRLQPAFLPEAEVDRLINAYEGRIRSHTDASDYSTLGFLYLEKARRSGDVSRLLAAQEAFTRAIDLYPSDASARVGLASALYGLHDFSAAYEAAMEVYYATGRLDALAVLADSAYARGDYQGARAHLEALTLAVGEEPAVLVRRAEAARIEGRRLDALTYTGEVVEATRASSNPRLRAWYQSFAAQMHFHLGAYEAGSELAESALGADPSSASTRLVAARLRAATGDLSGAIALYEDLVAGRPDPTYLVELGDLYLLEGRSGDANAAYETALVAAELALAQGVHDRVISSFLADHGLDPERALAIAREEVAARKDVGAYDALAWSLLAAGRPDEAAVAMAEALRLGTLDARFHYHAGMIAKARGDVAAAQFHLESALALSPQFQPLQANRARQALEEVGG